MTKITGQLHKMQSHVQDTVQYSLVLKNTDVMHNIPSLNKFIGQQLTLHYTGVINCIACQRRISKTYQQGYCFPCAQTLASCDMCILKPETCHYEKGTCREPAWGLSNCFIPHIVYLANSSGLKVGITKESNLPTRWIDQGATQALPIMRVKSRLQAGLLEVAIAQHIADKTNWRKMLQGTSETEDLSTKRDIIFAAVADEIQRVASQFKFGDIEMLTNEAVQTFSYPVMQYPEKIKSLCFDKTPTLDSRLHGIKGQYLIFDTGVINLRKYTGYQISIDLSTYDPDFTLQNISKFAEA